MTLYNYFASFDNKKCMNTFAWNSDIPDLSCVQLILHTSNQWIYMQNRPLFQEFKTGISHMQVGNVFLLSYIYICVCALSISFHTDDGMEHERANKTVPSWSITLSCNPFWVTAIRRYIRSRKRMGSCSRRDRIGRWKLIPNVEHYKYISPNTKQPNRKQWLYKCWICHVGPLMGHGWDLHQLTLPKLRPITRRAPYWGLILGDGTIQATSCYV